MSSMVRDIDPVVRALLTTMFGVVVHFGTVWTIEDHIGSIYSSFSASSSISCMSDDITSTHPNHDQSSAIFSPSLFLQTLFLHEYWVYLQHMNVLANPLLQHLDRRYGIALLKSKKHWVIAGTLSAYWTRESLGMFLCLPFLMLPSSTSTTSSSMSDSSSMYDDTTATTTNSSSNNFYNFSMTHYLILYSLLYHTYKSRGVRRDASKFSSSPLGIMTLVIDDFYIHDMYEVLLSVFRLLLQGSDTFIHYCIMRDLLAVFSSSSYTTSLLSTSSMLTEEVENETCTTSSYYSTMVMRMHILFIIWVIHAALNQLFRCSTASIMVMWWQSLTKTSKATTMKSTMTMDGVADDQDKYSHRQNSENCGIGAMKDDCAPDRTRSVSSSNCSGVSISTSADDDDGDIDDGSGRRSSSSSSSTSSSTGIEADKNCSSVYIVDDEFIVRRLLQPNDNITNGNAATSKMGCMSTGGSVAVDGAVRLSMAIAVLSAFFMLGLGQVPLKALPMMTTTAIRSIDIHCYFDKKWSTVIVGLVRGQRHMLMHLAMHSWVLWSLLHAIGAVFRTPQSRPPQPTGSMIRKWFIIQIIDLSVMLGMASQATVTPSNNYGIDMSRNSIMLICVLLTFKAYAQSMRYPKFVRRSLSIVEFVSKLAVLRVLTTSVSFGTITVVSSSLLAITWVVSVVAARTMRNHSTQLVRDDNSHGDNERLDVVFLGHPAFLSDFWALWLLPYSLKERWQAPFWALPLWPIHFIFGWCICNWGNTDYFLGDDNRYGQLRIQNWVAPHFGRHFVTHPHQVKENIEACARHAERTGVRVLCLGALNKAESINGGGWGVGRALGPNRKLSIIHGNHLTAAAVVETIYRCFRNRKTKLFLTGASSKVGWAVARALRDRYGYDILCHSTDPGRRKYFELNGFASASTLSEGAAYCRHWVVGKYDAEVSEVIPHGAVAIVFSVPHPLKGRRDLRVIEAGTLHMDLSRLDKPRLFANKLREHEIFACHAAGFVAAHRLNEQPDILRIDEMGPVDPSEMDSWLVDAQKLGFVVPYVEPVSESYVGSLAEDKPPVIIVGCGPSGLSVAAYLSQKQVPHIVLEAEINPDLFGSWGQHFSGLEITTQKKWCTLPGLRISDKEYPNDYMTAEEYQRYLKQYVHRYAINIRRGAKVTSIVRGPDQNRPYIVKYGADDVVAAWAVVVASGKHRIPKQHTSDVIAQKLKSSAIPHVHSAELCDDAIWSQAVQAAQNGKLCIVGFGNSAGDLVNVILQQCHKNCIGSNNITNNPTIHIATRTVPPVFPRRIKFLRVDTMGYLIRLLPSTLQDMIVNFLWWALPGSRACYSAFPLHLERWSRIGGRVPVIDKYGWLTSGFQSGSLVGHGPILNVTNDNVVQFDDQPTLVGNGACPANSRVKVDMVILATGYVEECVIEREDRLNGLYKCGFGNSDRFLPLRTICEDAKCIADDIAESYHSRT